MPEQNVVDAILDAAAARRPLRLLATRTRYETMLFLFFVEVDNEVLS